MPPSDIYSPNNEAINTKARSRNATLRWSDIQPWPLTKSNWFVPASRCMLLNVPEISYWDGWGGRHGCLLRWSRKHLKHTITHHQVQLRRSKPGAAQNHQTNKTAVLNAPTWQSRTAVARRSGKTLAAGRTGQAEKWMTNHSSTTTEAPLRKVLSGCSEASGRKGRFMRHHLQQQNESE